MDVIWCHFSAQDAKSFFLPVKARINFVIDDRDYYGLFVLSKAVWFPGWVERRWGPLELIL